MAGAAVLAVLPLVAVVEVWWARFGTFIPSWCDHEGRNHEFVRCTMRQNGGELGDLARFIPTAGLAYFRPDTSSVTPDWP